MTRPKWKEWSAGRNIEFIYWGASELLKRLSHPEQAGVVVFWFDNTVAFNRTWFQARFDEARKTAGPRYTPEVHIDLPIAQQIDAFERTEAFRDRVKSYARTLRETFRHFSYVPKELETPDLQSQIRVISEKLDVVLQFFAAFEMRSESPLPFQGMISAIEETNVPVGELLRSLDTLKINRKRKHYGEDPLETLWYRTNELNHELRECREKLRQDEKLANSSLMIIEGDAGTGKTHLLCDIAHRRIEAGCPTVLLMGKQFISTESPWVQALQVLDLSRISAEEFIGALETAAQVTNCRALLMIDGINEGMGQNLWRSHLAAFLTQLQRSPWIGTILSVRSSYRNIIEQSIRNDAIAIAHTGFQECEFNAMRVFFQYYDLDLPTIPFLNPEFSNPLYLKTLCEGLKAENQRTIPRGYSGITQLFQMYIERINHTLAETLDFDPKRNLVCCALEAFAKVLNDAESNYLDRERASEIINAFLPGKDFTYSLFGALLSENILLENMVLSEESNSKQIISLNYERFSDHLRAQTLLVPYKTAEDLWNAINHSAEFKFLRNERASWHFSGLIEALCIQVPERFGLELPEILQQLYKRRDMGKIWQQSIIWRAPSAFTDSTRTALRKFFGKEPKAILEALLMVATLPDHPWNACFLDALLRKDSMSDRDAWWSILLHHTWNRENSAVSRLVEWAWTLPTNAALDAVTLNLTAITLCWMFTTSNRFLRDRATKALVNLLTGKFEATIRLVEQFHDVDDPYVLERLYAAVYGVAMRTADVAETGSLAQCVYDKVFAAQEPPQHVLLRDYARGTVERALFLGAQLSVNPDYIRPPYRSIWPLIPSEEEIESLRQNKNPDSSGNRNSEWAREQIFFSVTSDDFARYVIGTNFSPFSQTWLSIPLTEAKWKSSREKLDEFVASLPSSASLALEARKQSRALPFIFLRLLDASGETSSTQEFMLQSSSQESVAEAEEKYDVAMGKLKSELSEHDFSYFLELMNAAEKNSNEQPGFDLGKIQRYILWRVFDLGWTAERFGRFDSETIRYNGREARKAERIGKKYQWIAYHEILALVSDHFQYRDYVVEPKDVYLGPWQSSLRDIDPSCMLRGPHKDARMLKNAASWWAMPVYTAWQNSLDLKSWIMQENDLPKVEELLKVTNPTDGSVWLNLCANFTWRQPIPADQEYSDAERRDIWYKIIGYLIRAEEIQKLQEWFTSQSVSFWGRWMPEENTRLHMFLGEHAWSPASRFFQQPYYGGTGWQKPKECPVEVSVIPICYLSEKGGFDCSIDESVSFYIPQVDILEGMALHWSGTAADYVDVHGHLAAQDPSAHVAGPSSLLIREDFIKEFLTCRNLALCWTLLGEKRVLGEGLSPQYHELQQISGLYFWHNGYLDGKLNFQGTSKNYNSVKVESQVIIQQ